MKRIIAILLAWAIITGTIHLDELVKLPLLFRHYTEHKISYPSDTVFNFLYNHYIDTSQADISTGETSHSELPFKSEKRFHSHFAFFALDNNYSCISCTQFIQLFFIDTGVMSTTGFSAIWQPPKIS